MSAETSSPLDPELTALLPPAPGPDCIVVGFTVAQMDALLAVLGASPYSLVASLIDTIRLQAADQWNDQVQVQALAAAPINADAPN